MPDAVFVALRVMVTCVGESTLLTTALVGMAARPDVWVTYHPTCMVAVELRPVMICEPDVVLPAEIVMRTRVVPRC
jgi:hypothetical protein